MKKRMMLVVAIATMMAGCILGLTACTDKAVDSIAEVAGVDTDKTTTEVTTTEKATTEKAIAEDKKTTKTNMVGGAKDTDVGKTTTENATTETPASHRESTEAPATTERQRTTEAPATTERQRTTEAPTTEAPTTEAACSHNWVTITDKEAWDEPVYETKEVDLGLHWYWPDGTRCDELQDCDAKYSWCVRHCVSCNKACGRECPEPDPQGRCALTIYDMHEYDYQEVQVDTIHHPAKTHQECSKCGARK